jgi:hypothetical protein
MILVGEERSDTDIPGSRKIVTGGDSKKNINYVICNMFLYLCQYFIVLESRQLNVKIEHV